MSKMHEINGVKVLVSEEEERAQYIVATSVHIRAGNTGGRLLDALF
jgi:hypothetical protein